MCHIGVILKKKKKLILRMKRKKMKRKNIKEKKGTDKIGNVLIQRFITLLPPLLLCIICI